MKQKPLSRCKCLISAFLAITFFLFPRSTFADTLYQNFEENNGSTYYATSPNGGSVFTSTGNNIGFANGGQPVFRGKRSMGVVSDFKPDQYGIDHDIYWVRFAVEPQGGSGYLNFNSAENDRLTFWTYSLPHRDCYIYGCTAGTDNNVGVVFYDDGDFANQGFEVWTGKKAQYGTWTQLKILFSQLPPNMDLAHITKIEFINYWPGTYYFDTLAATRDDRVYQAFEPTLNVHPTVDDFGWKWNDPDAVSISASGEPVREGGNSWKLTTALNWSGTSIKSQEEKYFQGGQTFWNVDLNPAKNDRLLLWVYGLPTNKMDNNLNIQFYDNGTHATDNTKVEVWTKEAVTYDKWTRLTISFSDLDPTLNLSDINKIQVQNYWPGTYYIDDVRASGPILVVDKKLVPGGLIQWAAIPGAGRYRVEESTCGPDCRWEAVQVGPQTSYQSTRLIPSWYRVRWEEIPLSVDSTPYRSPWTDPIFYLPASVKIDMDQLKNGKLVWSAIGQTAVYEVQSAAGKNGPWIGIYRGAIPAVPMSAQPDVWYRVRGIKEDSGRIAEATAWSAPLIYGTTRGFLKASGTVLKEESGSGATITLHGVNLGNGLLIEKWMTMLGEELPVPPPGTAEQYAWDDANDDINDEWTLRNVITTRFGASAAQDLLKTYQEAYIADYDFDLLKDMGVNFVRLPFYFRLLQNDDGSWIRNTQGEIDFSPLDRVVKAASERGIYVMLDLHGAPGAQSAEFHTGRQQFNKLFAADGENYRLQTIDLWKEIARHYKDNPYIAGYDLLNEPVGAPTPQALQDLYDRIYDAIRPIDPNHIILMEGIWDLATLPNPAAMSWTNVVYQVHYYLFGPGLDADVTAQKNFVDQNLAAALPVQAQYQVPVFVGEFNSLSMREAWEYSLQKFNEAGWSWSVWNYKNFSPASNWGLFLHTGYKGNYPRFKATQSDQTAGDSFDVLKAKLGQYDTITHHSPNVSLIDLLKKYSAAAPTSRTTPVIASLSPNHILTGSDFWIYGKNFGSGTNSSVQYDGHTLPVLSWSDTAIRVYTYTSFTSKSGMVTVSTPNGSSNEVVLFIDIPVGKVTVPSELRGERGDEVVVFGSGFGDEPGEIWFYPGACDSQDIRPCNNGRASVTYWKDNQIRFIIPQDAISGPTSLGISYTAGPFVGAPPVLAPIGNRSVTEGQTLVFTVSASDPDSTTLSYSVDPLPAGATFTNQTFSWTPNYSQAGSYSLTFTVQDGHYSDTETITIQVTNVLRADLVTSALSTTATVVKPGGTFAVSNTAQNTGEASAGSFKVAFHLSLDNVYGGRDDIVLTPERSVTSLAVGATSAASTTVTVPANAALGSYYVLAATDSANTVVELNENNNTRSTTNQIQVSAGDLVVQSLVVPTTAATGATFRVTNTVKNNGPLATTASVVAFYLSTDSTITTSDVLVGTRAVVALASGGTSRAATTLTVPSSVTPGTYYLGAIVDYTNSQVETNEVNNSLAGTTMAVTPGADLSMTALSAVASWTRGSPVQISHRVANSGTASVGPFYVGLYLSTDNVITTADTLVGYVPISGLAAGTNSGTIATSIIVPTNIAARNYYLGAIADYTNVQLESDETDNARLGRIVTVK